MIELEGLTKTFVGNDGQPVNVVDDVTFQVSPGEVFGLLGPNGAGKTTTLRMICTVLKPSAGFASVAGYDVVQQAAQVRMSIGFLSANTGVYDRMTAWEMVAYYGKLYGLRGPGLVSRLESLFDTFQMNDFRNVACGRLSTGMKQKVSIARALVHNPPVLVFDEPTAGLDVLVQRAVLQNIAALRDQGKTIIFSTHNMTEVQKICNRVAIIHKGTIAACGTLPELREQYHENDVEEIFFQLLSR